MSSGPRDRKRAWLIRAPPFRSSPPPATVGHHTFVGASDHVFGEKPIGRAHDAREPKIRQLPSAKKTREAHITVDRAVERKRGWVGGFLLSCQLLLLMEGRGGGG